MPKLRSIRQENFAREVAAGTPYREAYQLAGYAPNRANFNRLLRRPDVSARVAELQREFGERAGITADRVVRELARVAFGNVTKAFEFDADTKRLTLANLPGLPEEVSAAIGEVKLGDDGGVTIKMHPKMPALEMLAKYAGVQTPGIGSIVPSEGSTMERIEGALVNAIQAMARGEISTEDGQRLCQAIGVLVGAANGQKIEAILRMLNGTAIDAMPSAALESRPSAG